MLLPKNKKSIHIYINLSNISTGGAIQVAMSFIDHVISSDFKDVFHFLFSERLMMEIKKSHLIAHLGELNYRKTNRLSLFFYFSFLQPKKIFTLFGPLYSLKLIRGRDWITGFAQPWILYPNNRVYEELNFTKWLRYKITFLIQKVFFSNSHTLIVEHDGVKAKLQTLFKDKKIIVAKNCLNQIFLSPSKWKPIPIKQTKKLKIGVIGRNYIHKNLKMLPEVHDLLLQNHSLLTQFYCTLTPEEMNKMSDDFQAKIISVGEIDLNQCPDFYNNMDIIFFPSNLECFSATPLETLFMKKSIVCSNLAFNKNIIGKFGVYFEPNNPISAAEKIATVLETQNSQELEKAKKFVFSNFKSEDRFRIYINTILNEE